MLSQFQTKKNGSIQISDRQSDRPDCLYQCGLCKKTIKLLEKELIMCKDCGHRILYKQRSNKCIEYLAR